MKIGSVRIYQPKGPSQERTRKGVQFDPAGEPLPGCYGGREGQAGPRTATLT